MATVLIRATPGTSDRSFLEERGADPDEWAAVEEELELEDSDVLKVLRANVTFHLENLSDRIARVVLIDPAHGEHTTGSDGVILRPHAWKTFDWSRRVTSTELRMQVVLAQLANERSKLWVRDLAMNAYDVVEVVLNLPPVRAGRLKGLRLTIERLEREHRHAASRPGVRTARRRRARRRPTIQCERGLRAEHRSATEANSPATLTPA